MPVAPARFKPRRPGGKQHGVTYDQRRPSAAKRLYGRKWRKARLSWLMKHPECNECGIIRLNNEVDHIVPHNYNRATTDAEKRRALKLFWAPSNWQTLCTSCHSRKTAREDGGFGNPKG